MTLDGNPSKRAVRAGLFRCVDPGDDFVLKDGSRANDRRPPPRGGVDGQACRSFPLRKIQRPEFEGASRRNNACGSGGAEPFHVSCDFAAVGTGRGDRLADCGLPFSHGTVRTDGRLMRLTDTQIARFRDDGFLILPSLFSLEEVALLKSELPRLFTERRPENFREKGSDAVRTAMALHLRSEVYARLVRHPRLVEPARQLLGDDLYVQQVKVNAKAAFSGDVWQWHYDFATHHGEDGVPEPLALNLHVLARRGERVQRADRLHPWLAQARRRAGDAGYRDDELSALGGRRRDRGLPGRRGRPGRRQGAARHGADLRRHAGPRFFDQHDALAAHDLLADPQPRSPTR